MPNIDTPLASSAAAQILDDGLLGRFAVRKVSRTFLKSEMTDGGGTSGFIDLTTAIPPGSIILGWICETLVGFTGDTTATIQVGASGTVNEHSADTAQSVFAAGTVGSGPVVANAGKRATATFAPRVTITSSTDFTPIAAGAKATVTVFYIGSA